MNLNATVMKAADFNEPEPTNELKRFLASLFAFPGISHSWLNMPFRWSMVNLTKIAQCTSNLTSNLARVTWSISYPGLKDEQQLKVRNPAWKRVAPEPKSIPSARALLVTCIWFPLGLWRANHWPVRACIQRWPASKYALRPHSSL